MNNAQVIGDLQPERNDDVATRLGVEEARLLRIIEALQTVRSSQEWSSLKTEVFDNLVNVLKRDLRTEAEKLDPSTNKLNRIAGNLEWARRYADLQKFENEKRVELQNVRQQLYGKKPE